MVRRWPWIFLFVATPCAVAIWVFAYSEFVRVRQLGNAPLHVTTAEALRRARTERLWVVLSDASFDCRHSVMVGEYRYGLARAPGIPADVKLVLPAYSGLCPAPGKPIAGSIEPVEPGSHQRDLGELGIRAPSLWELSIVRRPSDALAAAGLLVFLGACVQLLGFFPYLKRRATRRLVKKRDAPIAREALLAQLTQAPLRLRRGYVFANFHLPALMCLAALCFGVLAMNVTRVDVAAIRGERARWLLAEETQTLGPAAADTQYRVWATPLLADVDVTWRDAQSFHIFHQKYGVLWASHVPPPYLVKHDAIGTLTSVGLALAPERYGSNLFLFVAGCVAFLWPWFFVFKLQRRWRAFTAVRHSPRPIFVPLLETSLVHHHGVPTGQVVYRFLAPSGESIRHAFGKPREAVLDETGTTVLVVTALHSPNVEPILVADDGYPFL